MWKLTFKYKIIVLITGLFFVIGNPSSLFASTDLFFNDLRLNDEINKTYSDSTLKAVKTSEIAYVYIQAVTKYNNFADIEVISEKLYTKPKLDSNEYHGQNRSPGTSFSLYKANIEGIRMLSLQDHVQNFKFNHSLFLIIHNFTDTSKHSSQDIYWSIGASALPIRPNSQHDFHPLKRNHVSTSCFLLNNLVALKNNVDIYDGERRYIEFLYVREKCPNIYKYIIYFFFSSLRKCFNDSNSFNTYKTPLLLKSNSNSFSLSLPFFYNISDHKLKFRLYIFHNSVLHFSSLLFPQGHPAKYKYSFTLNRGTA